MDLLLFIDSVRYAELVDKELPPDLELTTGDLRATRHSVITFLSIYAPSCHQSAFRLQRLSTAVSGHTKTATSTSDFIIGLDENGRDVRYSLQS